MNRTKQNIIDEFRRLLIEKPYTSITVRDIVERCGINRNTFYYYFAGIPELVVSYMEARADDIIEVHGRIETPLDCIEPLVELITENKQSIFHIYRSVQREVFQDSLDRIVLHIVEKYIDTVTAGIKLKPDGKQMMVRFYKCLIVGVGQDWLQANLKYDLCNYAERLEPFFNGASRRAFLEIAAEARGIH